MKTRAFRWCCVRSSATTACSSLAHPSRWIKPLPLPPHHVPFMAVQERWARSRSLPWRYSLSISSPNWGQIGPNLCELLYESSRGSGISCLISSMEDCACAWKEMFFEERFVGEPMLYQLCHHKDFTIHQVFHLPYEFYCKTHLTFGPVALWFII